MEELINFLVENTNFIPRDKIDEHREAISSLTSLYKKVVQSRTETVNLEELLNNHIGDSIEAIKKNINPINLIKSAIYIVTHLIEFEIRSKKYFRSLEKDFREYDLQLRRMKDESSKRSIMEAFSKYESSLKLKKRN